MLVPLLSFGFSVRSASAQVILAEEGSPTITTTVGDRIDITGGQTSADNSNLFHTFEQFDLEAQHTANFVTIPNIQNVVGRINSANASTVNGTLQVSGSDANLYLMNPAGILIGPEAQLNLSGSFTATTATGIGFNEDNLLTEDSRDYNALNGEISIFQFQEEHPGAVVNTGDLTVQQGESINLIGGTVVNTGSLSAPEGTITLAAAEGDSRIRFRQGRQLLSYEVERVRNPSLEASTFQPTSIGEMLTGGTLSSATELVTNPDGSVQLRGQQNSIAENEGNAIAAGNLSTAGEIGGNINVLGDLVTLSNADLNASGSSQGGLIRVGGDYKGNGPVYNARQTNIDQTSTLTSDALENGDGGRVIVWSDQETHFSGHINARGGSGGGNGGFAEVSGKTRLIFDGSADLNAPQGQVGSILLDPENWTVTRSIFPPPNTGTDSYISALSLSGLSVIGNVSLEASNNITVEDLNFDLLFFTPGRDINFTADSDGDGVGAFTMLGTEDVLQAGRGNVSISGAGITTGIIYTGTNIENVDGNSGIEGGNVTLTSSQGVIVNSIDTSGVLDPSKILDPTRDNYSAHGGNVTIRANNGDIVINDISTASINPIDFAGDGGTISLEASGNIQTGLLQTTSVTDADNAGQAGDISVNALSGNISVTDLINTQSVAINSANDAGSINIQTNNGSITTNDITASSVAKLNPSGNGGVNSGDGGTISLTALNDIATGVVQTFSQAQNNADDGGDITLTTNNGTLSTADLVSISNTIETGTNGDGGEISLIASGDINISDVLSFSAAENNTGDGGNIFIESLNGELLAAEVDSESTAIGDTSGDGGNVTLIANRKVELSSDVTTSSIAGGDTSGDGGTIQISGDEVIVDSIFSSSSASTDAGDAGFIDVTSQQLVRINGRIEANSIGGGNRADIELTGDGIALDAGVGGTIVGNTVLLEPASVNQDINIGTSSSSSGLDLLVTDLNEINDSVSNLFIGRTDGTGTVTLTPSIFTSVVPVQILGGDRLNGPNTDTRIHLTGAGEGYFQGEDLSFTNIENLVGGSNDDIFLPALGVSLGDFNSIDGGGGFNEINYSEWTGTPVTLDLGELTFANIQNIIGTGNGSTLIGDDSGQNWRVDGNDTGSVEGLSFEAFNNLVGGLGEDTFSFINNGNLTGDIDGSNGQDTLDYSAFNGPINIDLANSTASGLNSFNSIENFIGSSDNDDTLLGSNNDETFELTSNSSGRINGIFSSTFTFSDVEVLDGQGGTNTFSIENLTPATNSNWSIDGNNSGSVNGIGFQNFSNLIGNALDDTFSFINSGNITGNIDGAAGQDTLDYSSFSGPVTVELETPLTTGLGSFNSIETLIGSGNNDELKGSINDETFNISGPNAGSINGTIEFSSFERLDGQAGQDTLNYSAYTSPVSANLATSSATDVAVVSNFETFVGGTSNSDSIFGSSGDDLFQLITHGSGSINGTIDFSSFEGFDGLSGQNTLSLDSLTTTTLNAFDIDGNNSGSINGQAFNNFANLIGSAQDDSFNFINSGNLSGAIDGAGGQDSFDYSAFTGPISINLSNSIASGVNSFNSIESFTGSSSNNDTLLGANTDETFELASTNSGRINGTLTFNDIEVLDGQGGSNTFSIETLTHSTSGNWVIDGNNSGSVNGIGFNNFTNLVGNTLDDTFNVANSGNLSGNIDGAGGNNTLNYSAFTNSVTIDLQTPSASGIASFNGITTFIGSSNTDTLRSTNNDETFFIDGPNAGNIDGAINFTSFESLDAQAGNQDRLDFSAYIAPIEVNLATASATDVVNFSNFESFVGGSSNTDTFLADNSDVLFQLTTNDSGIIDGTIDFSSFEAFDGQGGQNTLSLDFLTTTTPNAFDIDGRNSGSINGQAFNNFSNLIGSAQDDTFSFINSGNVTGDIDGAVGQDTLDYSAFNGPVSIDLGNYSASGLSSFNSIENFIGSTNTTDDYIKGSQGNDSFDVTGDRSGTINTPNTIFSFSDIETLDGGAGDNTFSLENAIPNTNLTIAGGSNLHQSNNRIITNYTDTTWQLDSINRGSIQQDGATIVSFRDIQNLENASAGAGEQRVEFIATSSQITGSLNSGISDLTLVGNDINIGHLANGNDNRNATISGSGMLTIKPADNSIGIELGGGDGQDPNKVSITDGELAAIQDGFSRILIGGTDQAGNITLAGDAEFNSEVTLQSQGNIDTTGGEIRGVTADANIAIITDGSISGGNITTIGSDISLNAQQDISVESLATTGAINGQGILLSSGNGGINIGTSVVSGGQIASNDVHITAQTDVNIGGDIVTSGGARSGDLTITATSGTLTTGNITTANGNISGSIRSAGSVTLSSAGDVQIGFIDARGNGTNTEETTINITTPTSFSAQAAIADIGASLSTTGAQIGSISITYGAPTVEANVFIVQNSSNSGTSGSISTSLTELTTGEFIGSFTQENISLINRGIPPVDPVNEFLGGEILAGIDTLSTQTESLSTVGSGEASLVLPNTVNSTAAELEELGNIFKALETTNSSAFEAYLSQSGGRGEAPIVTLHEVQERLREIEESTEAQPAIVYVYFAPISPSVESFESGQQAVSEPDETSASSTLINRSELQNDQLEVMLITANDEPKRFRRWGVNREQVEQATLNLRSQVTSQFSTPRQYLAPAHQLYDWIVSPIRDHLEEENVNSLGFVMDLGLRTLPIATLHDGDQYLIENYSLGILPTISLTDFDNTRIARDTFGSAQVLAMGASEFTDQPPLPAVEAEVNVISESLREGDVFLNEEFVRENLKNQLQHRDYEILHLATHASFESSNLEESYIQLWDEKLSLNKIQELGLDQHMLDLIVLSACNTALGDPASEYGFAGFAVNSGVTTAVASMWPVNDEGTLGFMNEFYRGLRNTSLRSEAVRQAQLALLQGNVGIVDGNVHGSNFETISFIPELMESGRWDFSHPFYWSAFTTIGNPW